MVYASIREHFEAWMKEFEKEYESKEEHEKRLEIFKANKAFVEKHNAEHAEGKQRLEDNLKAEAESNDVPTDDKDSREGEAAVPLEYDTDTNGNDKTL